MNSGRLPWKQIAFSILIGLAAIAAAYFPAVLPLYPALLGFILPAWGSVCFAVGLGVSLLGLIACFGVESALFTIAVYLPAAVWLGWGLNGKKPYRTVALGAALALAAGYYCEMCLPSLLAGKEPFAAMEELFLAMANSVSQLGAELTDSALGMGASVESITDTMRAMSLLAPELTCGTIACLGMGFGLVDTVLARRLALPARKDLRPMAPFPLWQLSRSFTFGAAGVVLAALIVTLLNLKNASALLVVAECVLFLPILLMGLCFLDFLTRVFPGNNKTLRRVLAYLCIGLLFPYSAMFLLILGFVDRFSRIRRRFVPRDGGPRDGGPRDGDPQDGSRQ